jgi:hypothetical protein
VKKVLSILLLAILLFISGGYHFYYSLQRAALKKEMKRNIRAIDRSALVQLSFTPTVYSQLKWEDNSEFEWKGTWYDVVEQNDSDGMKLVLCIADGKETALLDALMKANENASHKGIVILKMITQDFTGPECITQDLALQNVKTDYDLFKLNFQSRFRKEPSQPPENC